MPNVHPLLDKHGRPVAGVDAKGKPVVLRRNLKQNELNALEVSGDAWDAPHPSVLSVPGTVEQLAKALAEAELKVAARTATLRHGSEAAG